MQRLNILLKLLTFRFLELNVVVLILYHGLGITIKSPWIFAGFYLLLVTMHNTFTRVERELLG